MNVLNVLNIVIGVLNLLVTVAIASAKATWVIAKKVFKADKKSKQSDDENNKK